MAIRFRLYCIRTSLSISEFSQGFANYTENGLINSFDIFEENLKLKKILASFHFEKEININQIDSNFEIKKVTINTFENINFEMYQISTGTILLIIKNPVRVMNKFFDALQKISINEFSYKLFHLNLSNVLEWLYLNYPHNFELDSFTVDNLRLEKNITAEVKFKLFESQNIKDIKLLQDQDHAQYTFTSITIIISYFQFKSILTLDKKGTIKISKDLLNYKYDVILNNFIKNFISI